MSQENIKEKIDDNDIQIIFEDKIDYPHFHSELIQEYDNIQILIDQYNDRKFRLDIEKEERELWNMSNDGSLTYYITLLISLSKTSYKKWLYSQNKH